jgi:restriction system protein
LVRGTHLADNSGVQSKVPISSLDSIEWDDFELVVGEIFRRQGYEVEINAGLGSDGGKDLTLRRDGKLRLVQCKRLQATNKVSVKAIREFYGLIVGEGATDGVFVTTGLYSRDAKEFADGKQMELLGRSEIEALMKEVSHPGENLCDVQRWINAFIGASRVLHPQCPFCRSPMTIRHAGMENTFWGCPTFPRCWGKREARKHVIDAPSYHSV